MKTSKYIHIENYIIKPNTDILLEETLPEKKLYDMYDEINKDYFNNELPDIKIYYSKLAQKYLGTARVDYSTEEMSIMIAYSIADDYDMIRNILAHEMIHIKQYTMDIQHGTREYSSPSLVEYILKTNDKGHNKYFKEWMDMLNKNGFLITVTQDGFLDIEMSQECYGICIVSGGYTTILWNNYNFDPEDIIKQFKDRFFSSVDTYYYFKTNNENIFFFTRLSSKGIRKNSKNIFIDPKIALDFLKIAGVVTLEKVESNETEGVDKELKNDVEAVLLQAHKYAITKSFDKDNYSYLVMIMSNVNSSLTRMRSTEVLPWIEKNTPKEIIDIIYKDWENVKVKDIAKIKNIISVYNIKPFSSRDTSNEEDNFTYKLFSAGLFERFTIEEIYEGVIYYLESELKVFVKKYSSLLSKAVGEDAKNIKGKELDLAKKVAEMNNLYDIIKNSKYNR